jgi:hypothetical protein
MSLGITAVLCWPRPVAHIQTCHGSITVLTGTLLFRKDSRVPNVSGC